MMLDSDPPQPPATHLVNKACKFAVEALEFVLLLAFGCLSCGIDPQVERLQQSLVASYGSDTRRTRGTDPGTPETIAISGATIAVSRAGALIAISISWR